MVINLKFIFTVVISDVDYMCDTSSKCGQQSDNLHGSWNDLSTVRTGFILAPLCYVKAELTQTTATSLLIHIIQLPLRPQIDSDPRQRWTKVEERERKEGRILKYTKRE